MADVYPMLSTYLKRSGHRGYLTPFFQNTVGGNNSLRKDPLLVVEDTKGEIAGALYLKGENTQRAKCLYGPLLAQQFELDGLHFEACLLSRHSILY